MKKTLLFRVLHIGDYTTQLLFGITINHYKDPYQTTSIMESNKVFVVAHFQFLDIPSGEKLSLCQNVLLFWLMTSAPQTKYQSIGGFKHLMLFQSYLFKFG